MDQDTFNLSIRKFLKMVGVSSQREIEQAVQRSAGKVGRRLRRKNDAGNPVARREGAVRR